MGRSKLQEYSHLACQETTSLQGDQPSGVVRPEVRSADTHLKESVQGVPSGLEKVLPFLRFISHPRKKHSTVAFGSHSSTYSLLPV